VPRVHQRDRAPGSRRGLANFPDAPDKLARLGIAHWEQFIFRPGDGTILVLQRRLLVIAIELSRPFGIIVIKPTFAFCNDLFVYAEPFIS
jgi:hypothetical protein